jgi:hypothetical protein
MDKEFIPYEQALELKELGFDEGCIATYQKLPMLMPVLSLGEKNKDFYKCIRVPLKYNIQAPLYQQAFRWFREKEGYHIDLFVDDDKTFGFCITYFTYTARVDNPIQRGFNTYEEAELACLKKLIEIVKTK